ncbi:ras GTPase-activating protein-binding protein 2 [Quillaja saponaria]|uniref:Ras GTPase-activating protein-binding protein 2 n=1 Tax=Quillaja saponaria TaxID=32244 RepID=A0AAD7LNT6_QUISA|nr:ras GTPase-activating protein-binding protein 2 [Quillaja saponaria]
MEVGNAFVHQYYLILHQSPGLVHRFYQDISKLGRHGEDGVMGTTTTMHAINEKILSLGYGDMTVEITSVDAQESYNKGVLVLVTGYMTGKDVTDNIRRKFTQSFFLAPQDKGYFVLNDVFRYVDDNGTQGSVNDVETPVAPDHDPSVQEIHISEKTTEAADDVDGGEVYNPSENGKASIEEEDTPVPDVVDENPVESQVVAESTSGIEETPKKSYASIVKVMKESATPSSVSTASSLRSALKSQEKQGTTSQKSQEQQGTIAPPPVNVSETPISSTNPNENGKNQEDEANGYSIYIKGLPLNATPALLENEFKKFGPIKSGGIQVRVNKGFCFGFVEFEVESAVHSAIEASPILINGRHVVVEEKKSTNRGNSRDRFPSGRVAGYRNEGGRGRGSFGNGRSFGRSDFIGRSEFGNRNGHRGGFSNRGNDGYQRSDQMGSNGGRVNRTGGFSVNSTAKTTASRVPAPA